MKVGRKTTYDAKLLPDILNSVEQAKGSMGQIADLNKIHRDTFKGWMQYGEEDRSHGVDSDFAQFSSSVKHKQAEVISSLVHKALNDGKSARFITWWLSVINREDFGAESEEMKQLKDLVFNQILPLISKGALPNGRRETAEEVDSESSS